MATMTTISFDVTSEEAATIKGIVRRAATLAAKQGITVDRESLEMDLEAVHCNGNPLRLADLLHADDFNLVHDVFGILRHLDRTTGKLGLCFVPRYTAPDPTPHPQTPAEEAGR